MNPFGKNKGKKGNLTDIHKRAYALETSVNDFVSTLTGTRDDISDTADEITDVIEDLNSRLGGLRRAQNVLDNVITTIERR